MRGRLAPQSRLRGLGCATSVDLCETLGWLAVRGSDLVADLTGMHSEPGARRTGVDTEITRAIESLALAVVAIRDAQHRAGTPPHDPRSGDGCLRDAGSDGSAGESS